MTADERRFLIKRALMQSLGDCHGYAAREQTIRDQAALKADFLQPATAELDIGLKEIDTQRLATKLPSERGPKLQLTDEGRIWLAQNAQ